MNSELFCCDWYKKDCNTIKPSSYKYPYRLLFISVDGSILLWMRSKLLANTDGVFFNFTRWLLFNFHCFLYKSYFILINGTFSFIQDQWFSSHENVEKKRKCDFIKDSTSFRILIGRKSKTYKMLLGIFCKNACMQNCKINSPFLRAVEKKSFKLLQILNWKILFDLNYWKKQYQTVVFGIAK